MAERSGMRRTLPREEQKMEQQSSNNNVENAENVLIYYDATKGETKFGFKGDNISNDMMSLVCSTILKFHEGERPNHGFTFNISFINKLELKTSKI